jgi:hypothetical protein
VPDTSTTSLPSPLLEILLGRQQQAPGATLISSGKIVRGQDQGFDWTVNEAAASTTVTATMPSAMATGKLALAHVCSGVAANPTLPTGWAWLVGPFTATNLGTGLAYATDPAAGLVFTQGSAVRFTVILVVYAGVDLSSPPTSLLDATATSASNTNHVLTVAGQTTVTDGDMLVSGEANDASSDLIYQPPGGWVLTAQNNHAPVGKGAALADLPQPVQGTTGSVTWTIIRDALSHVGYLVALKPTQAQAAAPVPQVVSQYMGIH